MSLRKIGLAVLANLTLVETQWEAELPLSLGTVASPSQPPLRSPKLLWFSQVHSLYFSSSSPNLPSREDAHVQASVYELLKKYIKINDSEKIWLRFNACRWHKPTPLLKMMDFARIFYVVPNNLHHPLHLLIWSLVIAYMAKLASAGAIWEMSLCHFSSLV